jgi:NAD(P)-dependent dehydrogenase (short-subunit alcohol dehydrogenase family)
MSEKVSNPGRSPKGSGGYVEELFGLEGEVAIVTGGAGVLPSAMARALANAGAKVALWGRGTHHPVTDAADKLVADLGIEPSRIAAVTVDTGEEESVLAAFKETAEKLGQPTILVNGVGGNTGKGDFVDIDLSKFEHVLRLNLVAGLVIPMKVCTREWIASGTKASVINLASMSSYKPLSGVWAYDAAKAAVLNLTEGAAKEFAPHGIRVNAIAPGFFLGYQNKSLLVANDETGELTDRGKSIISRTPMGRFGDMSEIEGATLFLASPAAGKFVTGVTIPVDGGYLVDNI